ncbi:hypothetical protein Tco_0291519 [Tanacetum coccineum]
MASQDSRLSKFEADFKQQQSKMTNKIDIILRPKSRITIAGTLPRTRYGPKMSTFSQGKTFPKQDTAYRDGGLECYIEEPEPTLEDEFQDLHLNLLVLEVLAHAPVYNVILNKYMESLELGKKRISIRPRRRTPCQRSRSAISYRTNRMAMIAVGRRDRYGRYSSVKGIDFRKFLIKNKEEIFTDAGDGVRIYPDGGALQLCKIFEFLGTMAGVDVNTLTMEQYLALSRENQALGMVKPKIRGNVNFKIKSQFMCKLKEDTFSGNKDKDAHDHIDRSRKQIGGQNSPRNYQYLGSSQEGLYLKAWMQFYDSGLIPMMRPAKALTAIQTMGDHSQKWHDSSTSRNIRSSSSKDGLAALVNKLDNLG